MRGAIFRPQSPDWVSNSVCPLSELIDMYHAHEATLHSDKVYALLSMSSDNFHNTRLLPDYSIPWKDLFETLIRHLLCKEISAEALPKGESAIIRGEGYILGRISAQTESTWNSRQDVLVAWRTIWGTEMTTEIWNSQWGLQHSAKQIMIGDVVCLFQGALKPTIIRFCENYWAIIVIAATPPQIIRGNSEDVEWPTYIQMVKQLRHRKLQCSWDWDKSPGTMSDGEDYDTARDPSDQIMDTWKSALVLGDVEEYQKAARKFQEAMKDYEIAFREGGVVKLSADALSITSSVDLDSMNQNYSQPPLAWAAEREYDAVISLLIGSLNADINFKDKTGQTAILLAAKNGNLAVMERLLQDKADINAAVRCSGRTAIQAAAGEGHLAVVERLLQRKANVNAAAYGNGRTALQAAAGGGHFAVVERLLQEKANVNAAAANENGRTALQAAAEGGHLEVVERLLQEKADVNAAAAYEHGRTALQAAAEGGHLAVVELLLQEKADVNAAAAKHCGRTALQAAAEQGHLAVVKRLLQEKANVNAADDNGRTALQAAAEGGHLAVVELLHLF
jgi:ankyrin repeat protein